MNSTKRNIPFATPWITTEDHTVVQAVLGGNILTHGPEGKAFEDEFSNFLGPNCFSVSVSSCMASLHLAYLHLGIGTGDEVIVPAQTHVATVHAVEWVGARPVFVDCEPQTGNLTASQIAKVITPRAKAISVVHFVGIPCNMPEIMEVARSHDLKVIEDCALAVGARINGQHVGLFGDVGCFSFYPAKHMTTGEGGMLVSRHAHVAERVTRLRAFGVDRTHSERAIPGLYDVPSLGLNYRMSEMQAALGRSQVHRLKEILDRRHANFIFLKEKLESLPDLYVLDSQSSNIQNSHYCLVVVLKGRLQGCRNKIVERLKAAGVGTSIYYPHPVPRLQYYQKKYGYDASTYPNAICISDHALALPVGPHLQQEDREYIIDQFTSAAKEVNP